MLDSMAVPQGDAISMLKRSGSTGDAMSIVKRPSSTVHQCESWPSCEHCHAIEKRRLVRLSCLRTGKTIHSCYGLLFVEEAGGCFSLRKHFSLWH